MSFFAGIVFRESGRPATECLRPPEEAAVIQSLGTPTMWSGDGAAFTQTLLPVTPEDRFETLPRVHADGRRVLLLDGRIDNREDLISTLGLTAAGRVVPDGEILAAALERWNEAACPRLLGDFGFAAWDRLERRLILACDQTGGRALYYHAAPDRFLFATTVPPLLAVPGVPRDLDETTLAHALVNHFPPPIGRSMFRAIAMLPAAGRLIWQDGKVRVDRYWRPDFSRRIRFRCDGDYVDAAREILDRAVADRLRAEGPVACQLSGGLDSPAVSATAARLMAPSPLHALTLVPDPTARLPQVESWVPDEWSHAQAVAGPFPNLIHHRVPAVFPEEEDDGDFAYFPRCGWPRRQAFNGHWFASLGPQVRSLGAKVVLGGQAGNATLTCNGLDVLADRLSSLDFPAAMLDAWRILRRHGHGWDWVRGNLLRQIAPSALVAAYRQAKGRRIPWRLQAAVNPGFAEGLRMADAWDRGEGGPAVGNRDQRGRLALLEHVWFGRAALAGNRLAEGFELRDPLGDVRLIDFCTGIPPEQFTKGGTTRSLGRRVLADRLPAKVLYEYRGGKQNPEWFTWMTRRRAVFLAELDLLERSPMASHILDIPRLRALVNDWPADPDAAQTRWIALTQGLGRGIRLGRFIRWAESLP